MLLGLGNQKSGIYIIGVLAPYGGFCSNLGDFAEKYFKFFILVVPFQKSQQVAPAGRSGVHTPYLLLA